MRDFKFIITAAVLVFTAALSLLGSERPLIVAGEITPTLSSYLPIIVRAATATPTPLPSATPLPTPTNTAVPTTSGDVNVISVRADGNGSSEPDEYVVIRNDDLSGIQLDGWTLRDEANHVFTFPSFVIQPGQTCRIYTNENHPEWCGFNYSNSSAIWNNGGDCAELRNSAGAVMDEFCY